MAPSPWSRAAAAAGAREWDEAKGMTISQLDAGGMTHDTTQWQAGDHVEMYEVGGTSFAIYELTQTPTPRAQASKRSRLVAWAGNPA